MEATKKEGQGKESLLTPDSKLLTIYKIAICDSCLQYEEDCECCVSCGHSDGHAVRCVLRPRFTVHEHGVWSATAGTLPSHKLPAFSDQLLAHKRKEARMGYDCTFRLSWVLPGCKHENPERAKYCMECGILLSSSSLYELDERILKKIDKASLNYPLSLVGLSLIEREAKECSWPHYKEFMRELSGCFLGVVFHLTIDGEEPSDLRDLFALNGKLQEHKAKVVRVSEPSEEGWG